MDVDRDMPWNISTPETLEEPYFTILNLGGVYLFWGVMKEAIALIWLELIERIELHELNELIELNQLDY